jgi:hypothetical protein
MIHALVTAAMMFQEPLSLGKSSEDISVMAGAREVLKYQCRKPADSKLSVESACYFHPLCTPSGIPITDVAPSDHKHHRGVFLAWFDMHGRKDGDFWGWGQFAPVKDRVIENHAVAETLIKDGAARFRVINDWMAENESLVNEELSVEFRREHPAYVLDLVYTLTVKEDLKLPQRAFSGFCVRMRKDGKAVAESPTGEVTLPAPNHLKPETDWPAASWYGYALTLPDGAQAGGAVIDHPKNPPALWHNPASIRMLNPCIVAPKDVVIKAAEPLVLRYRVLAWDGATPRDLLNRLANDWAK